MTDKPTINSPALLATLEANRKAAANKPTPTYTEAAPLTPEQIAAELRGAGLSAPLTTAPVQDNVEQPARKPRRDSRLTKQFPIFSCSAFILYLQGVPTAPELATRDSLRALSLDDAMRIPGLLIFRSLLGSGKAGQVIDQRLVDFCTAMTGTSYRRDFTCQLYQANNKEAHTSVVGILISIGVGMQVSKVMHREKATASLNLWKACVESILDAHELLDPEEYNRTIRQGSSKLSAEDVKDALGLL